MWRDLGNKNLLEKLVYAPGVVIRIVGGVIGVIMFLSLGGVIIWEILSELF
jgi:hypothetical protein